MSCILLSAYQAFTNTWTIITWEGAAFILPPTYKSGITTFTYQKLTISHYPALSDYYCHRWPSRSKSLLPNQFPRNVGGCWSGFRAGMIPRPSSDLHCSHFPPWPTLQQLNVFRSSTFCLLAAFINCDLTQAPALVKCWLRRSPTCLGVTHFYPNTYNSWLQHRNMPM